MSGGARMAHTAAMWLAIAFCEALAGTYTRLAIAGSLRRGKADVGDVEIVVRPLLRAGVDLLSVRCDKLLADGLVKKRLNKVGNSIAWGERYKALTFRGFPVDLFIVLPDRQWGPTLLIRTGPGEANEALVTRRGLRNRHGVDGVLPVGMKFEGGAVFRDGVQLETPEEEDVFAAVGLPWIPPSKRTPEEYHSWARWWREPGRVSWTGDNRWFDAEGRPRGIPRDAIDLGGRPHWPRVPKPVREDGSEMAVAAGAVQDVLF